MEFDLILQEMQMYSISRSTLALKPKKSSMRENSTTSPNCREKNYVEIVCTLVLFEAMLIENFNGAHSLHPEHFLTRIKASPRQERTDSSSPQQKLTLKLAAV